MTRFAMALSLAAACAVGAGGCSNGEGGGMKMNNPMAKVEKSSAGKADYFEVRKEGKTYVLGSEQSLKAFNEGQMPKAKEMTFENGKTVYVENSSYTDLNRLAGEYKKSKGL